MGKYITDERIGLKYELIGDIILSPERMSRNRNQ